MKYSPIRIIIGFFLIFFLYNCAKQGYPRGGEKDTTPPEVVSYEPDILSTQFDKKRIRIYFNEYITLKDVQQQLIISPPLKTFPEISPQGSASKYLELKMKDTLLPNTTYTINFGNSLVDNNESNPNTFLTYIFSTGNFIDSLEVNGTLADAFNRTPDTYVTVMLHRVDSTYSDSLVYLKRPTYITNSLDSSAAFSIKNVKEGKYLLTAMKDDGNNYFFNQKTDKIAFLSDFVQLPSDSVFKLTLFKEQTDFRALVPSLASKNRVIFGYEGTADDMEIKLLSAVPEDFRSVITRIPQKDSLNYWFDPLETDSLVFEVLQARQRDTFSVKMRKLYEDSLVLTPNYRGVIPLNKIFSIKANIPLSLQDDEKISVLNRDSVAIPFSSFLDPDKNQLDLNFEIQPNSAYRINALPGMLTDFYGNSNDSLSFNLTTKSPADYGNLKITLRNIRDFPILVELTDEKGETLEEIYSADPQFSFDFLYLEPAKYGLRIIFDTNGNKQWDTGNYLLKTSPEKVVYYPEFIEMRANWEKEEIFTLSN